jgi:hypothetical protein
MTLLGKTPSDTLQPFQELHCKMRRRRRRRSTSRGKTEL